MKINIFASCISYILFCLGCSTTYKGKVVSEHNSLPLENIHITLQNNGCLPSIVFATTTDKNGNFELKIPSAVKKCMKGKVNISLAHENYKLTFQDLDSPKNNIINIQIK